MAGKQDTNLFKSMVTQSRCKKSITQSKFQKRALEKQKALPRKVKFQGYQAGSSHDSPFSSSDVRLIMHSNTPAPS